MMRNTRFPITDPTAQTRNRSSRRPRSALRNAKRGTWNRWASVIARLWQGATVPTRTTLGVRYSPGHPARSRSRATPLAFVGGDEGRVHAVHHDRAVDHTP